jgi:hypothetical protein
MASRSSGKSIQLQGINFPSGTRDQGASIEILRFDKIKGAELDSWMQKNLFRDEDKWGIVANSKSKEETQILTMTFRRIQATRLRLISGRVERVEEEVTEPELCECHLRSKDPLLELYSYSAKQRTALFASLEQDFGKEQVKEQFLSKDAMKSLMAEAIEISSVSLGALGNPFFSDATLSGTDPANSKTYKELVSSGEIKSFRGRFQTQSGDVGSSTMNVTVSSKCKVRFSAGQSAVLQSDIEEFVERVANIAQTRDESESDLERKIVAS